MSDHGGGDPVVIWDKTAQRWFISELAYNGSLSSNFLCIAVSTTADATGSYNRYAYSFGTSLPDYPKYSVWPDAYYVSFNDFANSGSTFKGAEPCALIAMPCWPAELPSAFASLPM